MSLALINKPELYRTIKIRVCWMYVLGIMTEAGRRFSRPEIGILFGRPEIGILFYRPEIGIPFRC